MADIVSVISQYVSLQRKGREYVGICPFHDDHDPSLRVNPEKNIFKCFGCGVGGSANHFVFEYNKKFGTNHRVNIKVDPFTPKKDNDKLDDWKIVIPVPSWAEQPSFRHFSYGVPSSIWRYTDENAKTIMYVCRFNFKDGRKEVLPYSYCMNNGKAMWKWKGLPANRPLYNLKLIAKYDKPVVIGEGEKVCDAGMNSSDTFIFTTFQGGSNAYQKTDYSPLRGRNVVLLRDNDEPGAKCMDGLKLILEPICKSIYEVGDLSDMPEKWDIADTKWKAGELDKFIKSRIIR